MDIEIVSVFIPMKMATATNRHIAFSGPSVLIVREFTMFYLTYLSLTNDIVKKLLRDV
jgi:hypothetical protein